VDALFRGILGILIGATIHAEVYPFIQGNLMKVGSFGKLTFPGLLGVNAWVLIVPVVFAFGGFLVWLDRKGL
jgi:hypothetical protein